MFTIVVTDSLLKKPPDFETGPYWFGLPNLSEFIAGSFQQCKPCERRDSGVRESVRGNHPWRVPTGHSFEDQRSFVGESVHGSIAAAKASVFGNSGNLKPTILSI